MTDNKKPLFREYYRDWYESKFADSFDRLTPIDMSKFMSLFFAERVLRPRNPAALPSDDEDLRSGVIDGAGDCGIDFLSRENNTVTIIQGKYSGIKKKGSRPVDDFAAFDSFRGVLDRLHDYRSLRANRPLRELAAEIDWDRDQFHVYYITLNPLSENHRVPALQKMQVPSDPLDLADRIDFHLLDESGLNIELREALAAESTERREYEVRFSDNGSGQPVYILADSDGRKCYIGRISGAQIAELATSQNQMSALFNLNIRNYIGDTSTNKAIRQTALTTPDDFFVPVQLEMEKAFSQ